MTATSLLDVHLAPLSPVLKDPNIGDICINRPGEVFVYRHSARAKYMERRVVSELTMQHLIDTAGLIASASHGQQFSKHNPNVSADLHTGERVEILGYNAVKQNTFSVAIRKPPTEIRTDDLEGLGLFDRDIARQYQGDTSTLRHDLCEQFRGKHPLDIIRAFIQSDCNILFSGPTGVYKTTLARWTLGCLDKRLRIGSIEDALELVSEHLNRVSIIASRSGKGLTFEQALRSTMRLYLDAIFMGEVRGDEAIQLFEVMASGHRPTVSTIHALTTDHALRKLSRLARVAKEDLEAEIDLIVQLTKRHGHKFVSAIECPGQEPLYP